MKFSFFGWVLLSQKRYDRLVDDCIMTLINSMEALETSKRLKAENLKLKEELEKMNPDEITENTCAPEPAWQSRMRAEYKEVKARYDKLHSIIVKIEAGTCDFKPNCGLDLLKRQAKAMGEYLFVLEVRAQVEKVVLS